MCLLIFVSADESTEGHHWLTIHLSSTKPTWNLTCHAYSHYKRNISPSSTETNVSSCPNHFLSNVSHRHYQPYRAYGSEEKKHTKPTYKIQQCLDCVIDDQQDLSCFGSPLLDLLQLMTVRLLNRRPLAAGGSSGLHVTTS